MRMKRTIALAAAICLSGPLCLNARDVTPGTEAKDPATEAAAPQDATTPSGWIKLIRHNAFLALPVELNSVKGCLVLDTGAVTTCLCESAAKKLNVDLKPSGKTASGASGSVGIVMQGMVSARVAGLDEKAFPSLSGSRLFLRLPIEGGEVPGVGPVFGVIGVSELVSAGAVIDCAGEQIQLRPAGDYMGPDGWQEIQMFKCLHEEETFQWAMPVLIGETKSMMVVDTAAQISDISPEFAEAAGVKFKDSGGYASGAGANSIRCRRGLLPRLVAGGQIDLGALPVISIDKHSHSGSCKDAEGKAYPIVGAIGIDQLRRAKAHIDCRNGKIYLTKAALKPYYDTDPAHDALGALARNGDVEARQLWKTWDDDKVTSEQGQKLIARAKEKGLLLAEDLVIDPGVDCVPEMDSKRIGEALQALSRAGDESAKRLFSELAADKTLYMTPTLGGKLVAIARAKGLIKAAEKEKDGGGRSSTASDAQRLMEALQLLAQNGDDEAKKTLEEAQTTRKLTISSTQAGAFVARAREKGLLKAEDPKIRNESSTMPDVQRIGQAIQVLAQNGDEEAKKTLARAATNGGRLEMTLDQGVEFVTRAKEKGLLQD